MRRFAWLITGVLIGLLSAPVASFATITYMRHGKKTIAIAGGTRTTLENFVESKFCSAIDSYFELTGDDVCTLSKPYNRVCFEWVPDEDDPNIKNVQATAWAAVNGVWTPDP